MSDLVLRKSGVAYDLSPARSVKIGLTRADAGLSWDVTFVTDGGAKVMPGLPANLVNRASWCDYVSAVTTALGVPDESGTVGNGKTVFVALAGDRAAGFVLFDGGNVFEFVRNEWQSTKSPTRRAGTAGAQSNADRIRALMGDGPRTVRSIVDGLKGSHPLNYRQVYSFLCNGVARNRIRRVGTAKYALIR